MNVIEISGKGLSGLLVRSLVLLMLSTNVVSYSNSPTIITETFTIEKPSDLNES